MGEKGVPPANLILNVSIILKKRAKTPKNPNGEKEEKKRA